MHNSRRRWRPSWGGTVARGYERGSGLSAGVGRRHGHRERGLIPSAAPSPTAPPQLDHRRIRLGRLVKQQIGPGRSTAGRGVAPQIDQQLGGAVDVRIGDQCMYQSATAMQRTTKAIISSAARGLRPLLCKRRMINPYLLTPCRDNRAPCRRTEHVSAVGRREAKPLGAAPRLMHRLSLPPRCTSWANMPIRIHMRSPGSGYGSPGRAPVGPAQLRRSRHTL